MRLCSIASGSSGNCIYVGSEQTHLLIDTGISKKRIEEGLSELGLNGEDLSGILITHEHSDHIQGLGVFSRKYHVPIYATKGTLRGIQEYKCLGKMPEDIYCEICVDEVFRIGDLEIKPFSISHDANEPSGYRVELEADEPLVHSKEVLEESNPSGMYENGVKKSRKSIAVATDLGVYDEYTIQNLLDLNAIVLEANHDVHMVEVGPYPYPLKRRVLGNRGHLSNELTGRLLCNILHDKLKYIMLGHLSKENNYEELALATVKLEVTMGDNPYNGEELPLVVARRDTMSEVFVI